MARHGVQWTVILSLTLITLACIGGGSSVLPAGEAAPVFGIKQDGRTVTLDELNGQVVLVSFWSST